MKNKIANSYRPGRRIPKMENISYTAHCIKGGFEKSIKAKKIDESAFPPRRFRWMKAFFENIEHAVKATMGDGAFNASEQMENYEIARYVFAEMYPDMEEKDFHAQILELCAFIKSISGSRILSTGELETAEKAQTMFDKIENIGSGEAYAEMMHESHKHMDRY